MPAETALSPVDDGTMSVTRVEQFNQLVRAIVVLALTGGVIYGFIISKVVSTESFLLVAMMAFTWWFKSRDDDRRADAATKAAATPAPPGGTTR